MARSWKPLKKSRSLDLSGQGHLYSSLRLPTKTPNPMADLEPSSSSDDETSYSGSPLTQTAVEGPDGSLTNYDTQSETPISTTVDEATPATAVEVLAQDKKLAEDINYDDSTCYCRPSVDEDSSAIDSVRRVIDEVAEPDGAAVTDEEDSSTTEDDEGSLGIHPSEVSDAHCDAAQPSSQETTSEGEASTSTTTTAPELSPLIGFNHLEEFPDPPVDEVDQYTGPEEEDDAPQSNYDDSSGSLSPLTEISSSGAEEDGWTSDEDGLSNISSPSSISPLLIEVASLEEGSSNGLDEAPLPGPEDEEPASPGVQTGDITSPGLYRGFATPAGVDEEEARPPPSRAWASSIGRGRRG